MNIAETKHASAATEAQNWLDIFAAALQRKDAAAAALFLPDGIWRDIVAFTWTIEFMNGRVVIATRLNDTLARTQPVNFHIRPIAHRRAGSAAPAAIASKSCSSSTPLSAMATRWRALCPVLTAHCAPGRSRPRWKSCAAMKRRSGSVPARTPGASVITR